MILIKTVELEDKGQRNDAYHMQASTLESSLTKFSTFAHFSRCLQWKDLIFERSGGGEGIGSECVFERSKGFVISILGATICGEYCN